MRNLGIYEGYTQPIGFDFPDHSEDYTFYKSEGQTYLFGKGRHLKDNIFDYEQAYKPLTFSGCKEGNNIYLLDNQYMSKNSSILVELLNLWDSIFNKKYKNYMDYFDPVEIILDDSPLPIGEDLPFTKPTPISIQENELQDEIEKAVYSFCIKFGLPEITHILADFKNPNVRDWGYLDEYAETNDFFIDEYYNHDICFIVDKELCTGFKVSKFVKFADNIYVVYKLWDGLCSTDDEKAKDQILFRLIDCIGSLNLSYKSKFFVNKNKKPSEILVVENLYDLISFQMIQIITTGQDIIKCANPLCSNHFTGRKNKRFCSDACKQQNYRNKLKGQ